MRGAGYTAVGEFHYLGFEQALAAAEAAGAAGITFVLLYVAYARGGLERFRQASPAEYLNQVENLREHGIEVGLAPHSVRACPPRVARADRTLRRRTRAPAARPRRRAAARDRGLHRGARHPADRAAREERLPRPADDDRPRDARRRRGSSTSSLRAARASASAPRPRRTSATATSRSSASSSAASPSASARTRTRGSTRSRSSESSTGSRAGPRCAGTSSRSTRCFAIGADEGAASLGLDAWPDAEVDLEHRSLAGLDESDARAALVFGCAADVFV